MPNTPIGVPVENWHWAAFGVFVAVMLTLDLKVFHRESHEPTLRESAGWTIFWVSLALAFNGLIWWWQGQRAALEFFTGYVLEESLSMDNVFVFAVIFSFFRVPLEYQYRVLFWGILGAVIMRLTFVLVGAELILRFDWVMPIFGLFLAFTGAKLALHSESDVHPENNIIMRMAKRVFPVATGQHGEKFFVIENGRRAMTPLFLVLLVVESTDVIFAVDSVPAVLGVVDHHAHYFRFVVFTSNVFAILGLRALYFLLAGVIDMFRYLHYGLSVVLVFVGGKMIADFIGHRVFHYEGHLIPYWLSPMIIVAILAVSVIASLIAEAREAKHGLAAEFKGPPDPEGPIMTPEEAAIAHAEEEATEEKAAE